jgi:hypothetical protein
VLSSDRLDGELDSVSAASNANPAGVFGHVVYTVGDGLAEFFVREVVGVDFQRLTRRSPLLTTRRELTDRLLLFGIDADHRLASGAELCHHGCDVSELGVSIRWSAPSFVFIGACKL